MNFKSTKEFTKELSKFSDSEDVEIIIYPKKRGITEQTWSQGTWNGIEYTVKADVVQKGAVMGFEEGLDNFLEVLSDYDITELNGDNFSGLTLLESAGGEIEIVEVDWKKKLNEKELKELEEYGGELQLFDDGDWFVEDVVFDNGDIIEIEVKINDAKYILSKAEINVENKKHYHKNGKLKKIENFKDDKLDGLITEYYESGILWYTAEYKNGLQDGKIVSYDVEGNKLKESHLVKGEYEGSQTEWWPSGEIKAKRKYKDGKVISEETFSIRINKNVIMKLNIEELELTGISFADLLGLYEKDEIKSIQKTIEEEDGYDDEWLSFYKDDDSGDIDVTLITGSWEIIDHINTMKICENDPFIMIVKDSWDGENSKGEDVGYTTFEVLHHEDEPPSLKGGEYDKKTIMNEEELKEFSELEENEDIMYDVKYQDFYFVRTSEYNAKEWLEKWLSEDYGHNRKDD